MERWRRFSHSRGDRLNFLRRHLAMLGDQAFVPLRHRLLLPPTIEPFDGNTRFALDYGELLDHLFSQVDAAHPLRATGTCARAQTDHRRQRFRRRQSTLHPPARCSGASGASLGESPLPDARTGMRLGAALLDDLESKYPPHQRANLLLFCDTDIIFRNQDALSDSPRPSSTRMWPSQESSGALGTPIRRPRRHFSRYAETATRYPFVHHGAPAYFLQRSIWRAGLHLEHFASNHGGYILHRGRSAVAATHDYRPGGAHATAALHTPHYGSAHGRADLATDRSTLCRAPATDKRGPAAHGPQASILDSGHHHSGGGFSIESCRSG